MKDAYSPTQRALALARQAADAGRQALKAGSDALDGATRFVGQHHGTIAQATRGAFEAVGDASEAMGQRLAQACETEALDRKAGQKGPVTMLESATEYALGLGGVVGRSIGQVGAATRRASPTIGAATGSVVTGTMGTVSGAVDALAIGQADFDDLNRRLANADAVARRRAQADVARIDKARTQGRRAELLDLLAIGGVTLADMLRDPAGVPPEVEQAFELAYPEVFAGGLTFPMAVARLPSSHLVGLVNGVKGKLFELDLLDQLNHGGLPDGFHAELATSATQPGWDLRILDSHGHVSDVLQAKATQSVAYVREALDRYPNIDISTTSEVHRQLLAQGLGDHVHDSGISEMALRHKVEAAAGMSHHVGLDDFAPSALGLAVIAYSAFSDRTLSSEQRGAAFGDRAARATLAGAAAKTALIATGAWWAALVVGVGARVASGHGGSKRQRYEALKAVVESVEADNRKHVPYRLPGPPTARPLGAG